MKHISFIALIALVLYAPAYCVETCDVASGVVTISTETLRITINKCDDNNPLEVFSMNTSQAHEIYQIDAENFEWEMHFAEADGGHQPTSNVLIFRMKNYTQYDFFYQPPLSEKDPCRSEDGKSYRPENVVGSYAVYWKDRSKINGKYGTGKVCHIYRPYVVEDDGTKTWCTLSISTDTGYIRVTIPEETWKRGRLDYLDPTFGYTSAGGSSNYCTQNTSYALELSQTAPENGTLNWIYIYTRNHDGTPGTTCTYGLYSASSGRPNTRLVTGTSSTLPTTAGWVKNASDLNYSITSGSQYWGAVGAPSGTSVDNYYDTGSSFEEYQDYTTGTLPATWTRFADENNTSRIYSIYLDYTSAAPPAAVTQTTRPIIIRHTFP